MRIRYGASWICGMRSNLTIIMLQKSWFWRGKVIGGTGAINTMIYMRGNPQDFNHWEHQGCHGWSFLDCLPYFQKMEDFRDPKLTNSGYFGVGGPVAVEPSRHQTHLKDAFLASGSWMGYPITDDLQDGREGFGPIHFNIDGGWRWTTSGGYLKPNLRSRMNLHIALQTQVLKIQFDDPLDSKRAAGVIANFRGNLVNIRAKREVIISAGTIASPQLLMLSGIGPKSQLESHGIPVVQGDNCLFNHYVMVRARNILI